MYTGLQCLAGSYVKGIKCRLCPIGQYTDSPNQSKCLRCPDGKTTKDKGSTSIDQCQGMCYYIVLLYIVSLHHVGPCPKGHYSSDGNIPCDPCPIGYYQQFGGQTSCRKCLPGYTTATTGTTSTLNCIRDTTRAPPTTARTAPPTTKATTQPTTARTTAPPTTSPTPRGKHHIWLVTLYIAHTCS